MVERVFLGWDRPFLAGALEWILERREDLPGTWIVVPTAQGGRRLRESLAAAAGSLLAPKVVTPGAFLKSADEESAADWIERLAWIEVLEQVDDWSDFVDLFPESPAAGAGWSGGLAQDMGKLRRTLQENGLSIGTAARKLKDTVEAERWNALGRLEDRVERKIHSWQFTSHSRTMAAGLSIPATVSGIVLAGVVEMPPLVERALAAWNGPVTVLIGAPETEADEFSALGKPLPGWSARTLPPPNGSLQVVADPRQQAVEALRIVGERKTPAADLALGSADAEVGDELARTFTGAGWPAFHPAAEAVAGGLARWFKSWQAWLRDPTLACMADLLGLPETGVLVGGRRAQKAKSLAGFRDRWMVIRPEDLHRRIAAATFRSEEETAAADELLKAVEALEHWRGRLSGGDWARTMDQLLALLARTHPASAEAAAAMADWLAGAAPVMARVGQRGAAFWIDLMLAEFPSPAPRPPDGRVLDVQGWLELFHEPGSHLVLCGMNDGKVPSRSGGEPWLSENSRDRLGLPKEADRAARDAFLYQAMLAARRDGGRVDVICGKAGTGGEPLLPSRLLLAAGQQELPQRVKSLFREIEPPEAGLRWNADWHWQPRDAEPPLRLNVTSLRDYLACPFRYYLKHVLKMQAPEPGRTEWNARDFGTVAHEVLERWGRDPEARGFEKTEALHAWFSAELDRVVTEWFGKRPPLAIRIQTESLRQRLHWLSRVQAVARVEGWETIDVERKVELPVGGATIVAKIDRIDRHRETGRLRVLDYKTGKLTGVDSEHRRKIGPSTVIPAHLGMESPAVHAGEANGKSARYLWLNLQLPLYAAALVKSGEPLPIPCYFALGSTEAAVAIHEWADFETADLEAAEACADWLAGQIANRVFQPAAEKVSYDDFAILAAGRTLGEMFGLPATGAPA